MKTQVSVNQTLAKNKLDSVERNLEALSQNKVFGSKFMHFSVDEIRTLGMRVLDRLTVNEKLALDALCYTMSEIDDLLDRTPRARKEIQRMKEADASNEARTAVGVRLRADFADAAANLRRFQDMAQWYIDGDYDRILNSKYRREDFDKDRPRKTDDQTR